MTNPLPVPEFPCPYCGHPTNSVGLLLRDAAADPLDGPPDPQPGDVCGCLSCGGPLVFFTTWTGALALRAPSDAELAALPDANRQDLARIRDFALAHHRAVAARLN